jgi:hypothetical protein
MTGIDLETKTMINKSYPTQTEIESYILGLLPPTEMVAFTAKLQIDRRLQLAVRAERQIGRLVRGTIKATTAPNAAQLRAQMPPLPQQGGRGVPFSWRLQAVALTLLLLLVFGATYGLSPTGGRQTLPGGLAATATQTSAPTATATATQTAQSEQQNLFPPPLQHAPRPLATPKAGAVTFAHK